MTTTKTYLGKKPLTGDHEPAAPGVGERACLASYPGAIGDCTRTKGHPLEGPEGFHQGAHGYAWTEEEAPAPTPGTVRKTSAYTLRITVPRGELRAPLDAAVASLPSGVGVTDQHYADDVDSAYVSLTWRSRGEDAALATAETVRDGFHAAYPDHGAVLTTGLGVHRRVVETFPEEETMESFVERHRARDHEAVYTVAGAPGTGRGTWCSTCKTYGPSTVRVLSPEETR